MAAVAHPSSSSSSDNYDYNVFLNFRGVDTRGTFTDHLYAALVRAGIRTFRDSEELHHGEEIGPKLLKSIEQSRISIPIFSENYASSKWCLQELTKMMECNKTCGQIVWPIFYKVDPSHVKNQTGCFEEAFLKHEREQSKEKVKAWRESLNKAGKLKGWDSKDSEYRYETNLINSVVERALSELIQITTLQVAKHPIGIDSHVEEVMRMLDIKSGGVQFVGIHGMGGIGKTTMAKAVFNKISSQFESCSFLDDVRERSREGLVKLQNELVSDISKRKNEGIKMVDRGINVIKETFSNKKVLIILDDVDQDQQLDALAGRRDWFGLGSRIIITTRDEHILNVDQVEKSKIYKPDVLDQNLSLQLFSKHAFGRDQPPQDFRELSKRVVFIAGGLPLSLEVLGSFLRDKRRDMEWESTLKMLKKFPNDQVQKKLQISYDGLNEFYRDIFLDIACFFIGVDEENVIPAWEDSDNCPRVAIKVLVHKSLVKIDSDNKLRMHDQLRDMGREIVRRENPKKPGERSRLWSHEEALDVLKKPKGIGKVEGLFLNFSYEAANYRFERIVKLPQIDPADLLTKAFEVMSDLRLLKVDHADHDGNNFGHLPQGIKWLSLKGISSKCVPTISHLEKLAVLNLSRSNITNDWNGWQQIQLIRTLKVLDLSRCYLLKRTPRFSCDTSLERLILDYCRNLVTFHESIGHLQKLVFLSLDYCPNLTELPDSICKLSSIRSLILSGCKNLEKLPKELGNMESLTELIIDHTSLEEIPDAIGLLEKLERLSARRCGNLMELPDSICKLSSIKSLILSGCKNLEELPKELGNMESLTELIIDETGIREIPDSIGLLEKLETLTARYCENLRELPDSICKLSSIKSLILFDCCKLEKLPKELGNMESLTELIIDFTRIEEIPDSIGLLEKLERLSAKYSELKKLPNLSNLKSLQALCLSNCRNLFEIQGISGLSLLQQLDLEKCTMLQLLPELPPGLIKLNIRFCTSMERLPNLSTLKILKELLLDECHELVKIESIDGLTLLQKLDLTNCKNLQSLPELPSSLIKLIATDCSSIERLTNLSNLKNLQALLLRGCEKLSEIQGISGLSLLQELDLTGCITLQSLPELPRSLIRLNATKCSSIERLTNLSSLKNLQALLLHGCEKLSEIQGISGLSLLQELDLKHCIRLQSLPELPPSLVRLDVSSCISMKRLPNLPTMKSLQELPSGLTKVDARYCGSIEILPNLSNLKSLQELYLCCSNLSEIQDVSGLSLLQELDLKDCKMLRYLPGLPSSLIKLVIEGCMSMERLPNLSSWRSLKVLRLCNCMNLANIQGINDLTLLQEFYLKDCRKLQYLSELPSSLTTLHVYYYENQFEIDLSLLESLDLSNLRNLEILRLEGCNNLAEIRGLESLESLINFKVCGCPTYIKSVQKTVSQGLLPTAAIMPMMIYKSYHIPDDDNIKGTIFYFVYRLWHPASPWPIDGDVFTIEVYIQRNDGKKTIRCFHEIRIEGVRANTDEDQLFYSCYFQGLTWFGFPLKKRDKIRVTNANFQSSRVRQKMLDLVMEYEAMKDSQQLEKRVIHLITPTTKKRPREYDDADPSNWKLCLPRGDDGWLSN